MTFQQHESKYTPGQLQELLRTSLAEALYLDTSEVDIDKPFVDLGLDSIVGVEWMKIVNKKLVLEVSATRVYDYTTIKSLASFLYQELEKSAPPLSKDVQPSEPLISPGIKEHTPPAKDNYSLSFNTFPRLKRKPRAVQPVPGGVVRSDDKIAIIGMSGRYPQADNMQQYWDNLARGKNSVTEIPPSRWDIGKYYDPDPAKAGKMYCKWLGVLNDADCFDPLFFQIPPAEAESMDPQHRIFLQESYRAFEDAGYSGTSLGNTKCGVYLGIMSNDYTHHLQKIKSPSVNITGNSFAIGAARIAYFLNLKGPAIPIDTACSSSLVAIHVACQGLLNREIDMALAGGVSLYLNPDAYVGMCQAGMLSPEGQCKTFDNAANGFVPGEGAGALVLKRLKDAERDKDFIYGVILGSGINQDGKTNGITAPSVNSQIELERDIYTRYDIDPETISYVEAHGTGTKLGDPIELEALATVFKEKTSRKNFCAIGSVKSNIGHTSGAAGVASIQKVLLSMRHRTLVPTLNVTKENTIFDFQNSPFYISREKQDWNPGTGNSLRRAAISSFGFSGTNAHLVIEEYPQQAGKKAPISNTPSSKEVMIPLSARTADQLEQRARDLLEFIRKEGTETDLTAMAYTLQTGRDEMRERAGFIVSTIDELEKKLQAYIDGRQNVEGVYRAQAVRDKDAMSAFGTDAELQKTVDNRIKDKAWPGLLELWVKGVELDWNKCYDHKPQRIGLPAYPFAKERYWVDLPEETFSVSNRENGEETKVEAARTVEEKAQKLPYHPVWKEAGLPESPDEKIPEGPILIVDATEELYLAMAKKLEGKQEENALILVKPGHTYEEKGQGIFTIDPGQEEHFQRLLESLKIKGRLPRQIIHQGPVSGYPDSNEKIGQQLKDSFYTLFYLCKSLAGQKHPGPLKILSFFPGSGDITAPHYAALGGFFKTLALENPNHRAKMVEMRGNTANPEFSVSEKVNMVLNELREQDWDRTEVRYTLPDTGRQARYVRILAPFTRSGTEIDILPLKQNGVYIISGGLGGLGLIFGEYLVKNFRCRLVLFGRSPLKAEQEEKLKKLRAYGTDVLYLQGDVAKLEDVQAVVKTAKARFSQVNGIIHSAGVNKDSFILRKSKEEADAVLTPKIYGAVNLDLATKEENLDVFILFSSIAGVMGNPGQCDYAYANNFLDAFAETREKLAGKQQRYGRTLSINWPYWENGGMSLSPDEITLAKEQTGFYPLPGNEGVKYLEEFLSSGLSQGVALYGLPSRVKAFVEQERAYMDKGKPFPVNTIDVTELREKTESYLKNLIGKEIKLAPERIDSRESFEVFGIDSIIIGRMNISLEKDLGTLPKTLFYEYPTIEELTAYLVQEARQALTGFFELKAPADIPDNKVPEKNIPETKDKEHRERDKHEISEPVAIIGIHGHYPQSEDLNKYWENLRRGRDMTGLVPESRWNYEEYYDKDPEKVSEGKIYCKWGGFVDDVDKFDPHFFNISPEEAGIMDPQERLFLESVWAAIEDAGYTREGLKKRYPKGKSADVGVFVGVTTNTYNLLAAETWSRGNAIPGALPWSIANRVSYFFDFQGPSMPVDTACSSSSVAIHLACESLKKQECQVAVAGGVNLYLHPSKYHSLCKNRMVSLEGKCRSYGAGDDGFVPGEGVGSVLLKPLSKAIEDKDHIYAVIKGSAFDHSGRSNGYATPNPNSQASLISHTLSKANVTPETISYIEGHGTGTQLGDSLEIVALTNVFRKHTGKKQFCPIGSVKANIGHPESAAGIAGVAKVLLQLKHKQLAPTIHSEEVNPNIEFRETPFYLQHKQGPWKSPSGHPRRALINSFGAGGVNACMVIEEYEMPREAKAPEKTPHLIVLSSKNKEGLKECVNRLLAHVGKEKHLDLTNLCYTLQVGREAMSERLAIVVSDRSELMERLKDWKREKPWGAVYQGKADMRQRGRNSTEKQEELQTVYQQRDLDRLAEMWVAGAEADWENLYPENKPMRISLPTSPFSRKRYWFPDGPVKEGKTVPGDSNSHLHPLISYNSSTLKGISFSSLLSDSEFYARDHEVNKERIFPGSGFLEIAGISGNIAGEQKVCKLRDIVWAHPLSFREGPQLIRTFLKPNGSGTEYQIVSFDDENERIVHSEGKLFFRNGGHHTVTEEKGVPVKKLKDNCAAPRDGKYFYELFSKAGFNYGPAFQTVQEFFINGSYALSRLKIADHLKADFGRFILHPSLLDGAMQTVAGLISGVDPQTPYLPFAIDEVEIIRPLSQACYAYVEYADPEKQDRGDIKKFNIQLLNEEGIILVRIKNFYARALAPAE